MVKARYLSNFDFQGIKEWHGWNGKIRMKRAYVRFGHNGCKGRAVRQEIVGVRGKLL
jgi:hypothetical protein